MTVLVAATMVVMDVMLVSGRSRRGLRSDSFATVAERAVALVGSGHRVRWLCPLVAGETVPQIDGVEVLGEVASQPRFRAVESGVGDFPVEQRGVRELRVDPPDVIHQCSYGWSSSAMLAWLAARLGVPVIVEVDIADTLCHRGSLVDQYGEPCERFEDPRRCVACCQAPDAAGLSRLQSWGARLLRPLGGLSPFPHPNAFRNRLDLVISGLQQAAVVIAQNVTDADWLQQAGVPRRLIDVVPVAERSIDRWLGLYATRSSEFSPV